MSPIIHLVGPPKNKFYYERCANGEYNTVRRELKGREGGGREGGREGCVSNA